MGDNPLPLLPLVLDAVPEALRRALAQEGIPVRNRRRGLPEGRFVLFDSRADAPERLARGQVAVDVDRLRKDCDADPFRTLLDERSARFQWRLGGLTLTEQIARVDKRAARRRVLERLRTILEELGGIWLRVAPFPFPYRSAFNFRIDYDRYGPADFDATLAAIRGHEQATSHFVSGAAYEPAADALARLRGLDVGSHGYWHHTYRSAGENLQNVARGIETLQNARIEPSGFAAPHGRFNRGLLRALENLGVGHSSEFGLACDELPFFAAPEVLQIPVHPVSLGLFLEAAARAARDRCEPPEAAADAAVETAARYFDQLVRSRHRSGQTVFLYGHPTGRLGRYPQFVQRLLATVSRFSAIWKTTLTEFAHWWRLRAEVRLEATCRGRQLVVTAGRLPPTHRIGIEYCRGMHVALLPLDGRRLEFSPQSVMYEKRDGGPSVRPVRIDRAEGLRGRLRRLIDWERVTPIDEIGRSGWRNWAKRALRRVWRG
ncbi:MAG: hypothetical protein ACYTG0_24095 [Planctomycetota bacterium]|jgi:hypothetical protein